MPTTPQELPTEELIWFSWVPRQPRERGPEGDLIALAEAIRRHQSETSHRAVPKRPADHALYRRLEEIERSVPPEDGGNRFQIRGH
jgi:hypothetical protein